MKHDYALEYRSFSFALRTFYSPWEPPSGFMKEVWKSIHGMSSLPRIGHYKWQHSPRELRWTCVYLGWPRELRWTCVYFGWRSRYLGRLTRRDRILLERAIRLWDRPNITEDIMRARWDRLCELGLAYHGGQPLSLIEIWALGLPHGERQI